MNLFQSTVIICIVNLCSLVRSLQFPSLGAENRVNVVSLTKGTYCGKSPSLWKRTTMALNQCILSIAISSLMLVNPVIAAPNNFKGKKSSLDKLHKAKQPIMA